MIRKLLTGGLFLLGLSTSLSAQDSLQAIELKGYLKALSSFNRSNRDFLPPIFRDQFPGSTEDYQLHQRFDLRYYPSQQFTLGLGMRNRLFWGFQVRQGRPFTRQLDLDPGLVDLSFVYWQSERAVLHTIFDRAWLQWENQRWSLRLGRQRINWGVNTVWNPNDIFNQYNYFDFDYEERPGSDALRLQYFPHFNHSFELALSPARDLIESVAALLYKTNRWNYDWQFLGGYYRQDLTAGMGWAGSILNAGFKGELNYYHPLVETRQQALVLSISGDYVFANASYLQLSYLYNGSAQTEVNLLDFGQLVGGQVLSAKNLFIFRHTIFSGLGWEFTPLFSGQFALMVTPDLNNLIVFPSLSYSLGQNLDALVASQFFATTNAQQQDRFDWLALAVFGRLKWSF